MLLYTEMLTVAFGRVNTNEARLSKEIRVRI